MNTLFVVNDAPYGTERAYNALRLAASVARHEGQRVRLSRTSGSTPRRRWCTARSRSSRCRSWASASTTCSRCTRSGCCRALERRLALGPLRYLLNGPQMHIFHHAKEVPRASGVNFGVVLSVWDWVFGTAWIPNAGRTHALGFDGVERFPRTFLAQLVAPFRRT